MREGEGGVRDPATTGEQQADVRVATRFDSGRHVVNKRHEQIQRRHLRLQGNKSWSKIAEAGGRRSLEIIGVELSTREEWVIVDACREGKEINNI